MSTPADAPPAIAVLCGPLGVGQLCDGGPVPTLSEGGSCTAGVALHTGPAGWLGTCRIAETVRKVYMIR